MNRNSYWLACTLLILPLLGCQAPKFAYQASPAKRNPAGPSILVMPITDGRTNKMMDHVLEKNYFADVQRAIADELESMGAFRQVIFMTNSANEAHTELKLAPKIRKLEWEIPNYGKLQAQAFAVGLFTGVIGASIYLSTDIDVYGRSTIDVRIDPVEGDVPVLETKYSATVTNRLKKASCDSPKTKASMMSQAFQKTMEQMKADIANRLNTNSVNLTN
jgi:hypothetical protein